jgi:hypothetical protein
MRLCRDYDRCEHAVRRNARDERSVSASLRPIGFHSIAGKLSLNEEVEPGPIEPWGSVPAIAKDGYQFF